MPIFGHRMSVLLVWTHPWRWRALGEAVVTSWLCDFSLERCCWDVGWEWDVCFTAGVFTWNASSASAQKPQFLCQRIHIKQESQRPEMTCFIVGKPYKTDSIKQQKPAEMSTITQLAWGCVISLLIFGCKWDDLTLLVVRQECSLVERWQCLTFDCEMTGCVLRRGLWGPALVCGVLILGET